MTARKPAKTVRLRVSFEYELFDTPGWWRGIRSERADLLAELVCVGVPIERLRVERVPKGRRGR